RCASCIFVAADCNLHTSEQDWEKFQREYHELELQIARLKLHLTQSKVELLELQDREHSYAYRDLVLHA
ncbi:hypothetical protein COCSADRAFT_82039, partial [Bipolaris sorokiniana ND90Pr]